MDPLHDLPTFRRDLIAWLDAHDDTLRPSFVGFGSLDLQFEQFIKVKRALFDAGWGRYGWPESVGGLGGSPLLRAVVGEEIATRDLADAGAWSMIEVLAPTVIQFGTPELTAEMVPPLLRGDEAWCQGFSEPGTGSDLASLTCRAIEADGGWLIRGQKVWTSFVQYSQRCILLARTGEPGSAHRGISAFFVDVDSPGITARPIETQNSRLEFAEVFYDDVFVPSERMLGQIGQGWQVAMDILPYERSTAFWHRGAFLHHRFDELVQGLAGDEEPGWRHAAALGEAYQSVMAFRSRSRDTQRRLDSGVALGAETSIDKILIASAEQLLFDTIRDVADGAIEFEPDSWSETLRMEYLYARAATIYGGTGEIQRNIVARRLLDLGSES